MSRPTIKVKDTKTLQTEIIRKGYSLRSFCTESGISNPTLYCIIDGSRNPSAKTALKIATTLELKFEDLFTIDIEEETT